MIIGCHIVTPVGNTRLRTLTFVFGRFQPPTKGHHRLLVAARQYAGDGELRVYPSRTHDHKKNPLTPEQKHHFLRLSFPSMASCFVDDERVKTALDVMTLASEEGFKKVVMVVGGDRLKTFHDLTDKYNGDLYDIEEIQVVSGGERDPESDGVDGVSATQLREAAVAGDLRLFRLGLPDDLSHEVSKNLFHAVAGGLVDHHSSCDD